MAYRIDQRRWEPYDYAETHAAAERKVQELQKRNEEERRLLGPRRHKEAEYRVIREDIQK